MTSNTEREPAAGSVLWSGSAGERESRITSHSVPVGRANLRGMVWPGTRDIREPARDRTVDLNWPWA